MAASASFSVIDPASRHAVAMFDRAGDLLVRNAPANALWTPALDEVLAPRLDAAFAQLRRHPDRNIQFTLHTATGDIDARVVALAADHQQGFVLKLWPVDGPKANKEVAERVRWRYALENAEDGLWDWSAETGKVYRSPRCFTMLGYPPDHFADTLDAWSSLVHPNDALPQQQAITAHLDGTRSTYRAEYRIRDAQHRWRWLLDRGKVIGWSPDGRPTRVIGTHTDITDYKDLELRLREREMLLDEAQRIGHLGSWVWEPDNDHVHWSSELRRIFGWPLNQPPPPWRDQASLFPPESFTRLQAAVVQALATQDGYEIAVDMLRPDGERRHVEIAGEVIAATEARGQHLIGVVRDVTDERRANDTAMWRSKLLNRIAALGHIGGFDLVLATREFQWTDENYLIHGMKPGTPVSIESQVNQYDPESRERLRSALKRMIAGETSEETGEVNFITPDDRRLTLRLTASVEMHDGIPVRITGLTQDITREREAGQRIEQLAHFDTLTSLPNRFLFRQRAEEAIRLANRTQVPLALLFIDLDRFKTINDANGHAAGDQLLQEVAGRLKSCVRGSDLVARMGGDEFVVLLCEMRKPEDAARVAEKIIAAVGAPMVLDTVEAEIGCSIGIAVLNDDNADLDALLRAADAAMYAAKEAGRNCFQYYNDAFYERAQRRVQIEKELRLALLRNELALVYQPTIAIAGGTIEGFEALLRWRRHGGETCSPVEFIPIAEDSGEIVPIGRWVLREACRQARAWADAGMSFTRIAVNVSAVQLRAPDYAAQVLSICEETGWPPERLVLELTESALMRDTESLRRNFALLESRGARLAVDDFGTGFSNLHYLHRFPVQHLKIDRSFVGQMLGDTQMTTLTQAIVHLGHALALTVVAEGVETDEQLQALRAQGCDEVQGYLYTPPLPPDEMVAWVKKFTNS